LYPAYRGTQRGRGRVGYGVDRGRGLMPVLYTKEV
jgi:hypothetical protein